MNRRSLALLIGIGIVLNAAQRAEAATLELIRNSRPVTSEEVVGGAPVGGTVHDFFVTSDADLLVLGPAFDFSIYKHPLNSNHEAPEPELVAMYPAVGASSFLRLPGDTVVLGGGFTMPGSGWGDFSNDGPQSQFQFGRLTTTQAGTFSGSFYVRGAQDPIVIPFSLALPGSGEGLLASPSDHFSLAVDEPKPQTPPPTKTPPTPQPQEPRFPQIIPTFTSPPRIDFQAALERKWGRTSDFQLTGTHLLAPQSSWPLPLPTFQATANQAPEPAAWVTLLACLATILRHVDRRQILTSSAAR
jgi:hypothetical protein